MTVSQIKKKPAKLIGLEMLESMWSEGIGYVDEVPIGPEAWRELIRLAKIGLVSETSRPFRAGFLERGRLDAEIALKQAEEGQRQRAKYKSGPLYDPDYADMYNTGINYSNNIARDIRELNRKPPKGTLT